jgi:predicted nucleotidyltransferase
MSLSTPIKIADLARQVLGTQPILVCEVGSTAHGVSQEGTDDLDLMGITVPSPQQVFGFCPFEHDIYRTAAVREGRVDAPSQPGDIDMTWYSLRKFAGLAKKGNPSILMMFFAPTLYCSRYGQSLRQAAPLFWSKEAGSRFVGYMKAQRARLAGERGQKRCNRPELVDKYGYDTKYAYHILRLGMQGLEFVRRKRINVPVLPWLADFLLDVRNGKYELEKILQWADEIERELEDTIATSNAPDTAPEGPIVQLITNFHTAIWGFTDPLDALHNVQVD